MHLEPGTCKGCHAGLLAGNRAAEWLHMVGRFSASEPGYLYSILVQWISVGHSFS